MSTTVTYKGSTLTTVENETRTLTTRGKYLEDNLTLVDETISPELAVPIVWDSTTNMYVPDCTFQEIADAFVAQRPITASVDGTDTQYGLTADGWYDWNGDGAFYYFVYDGASYNPSEMVRQKYEFTSTNGVRLLSEDSCIKPSGNKAITANGTGIDVTEYASVDVNVPAPSPTLQTITKSYTPTEAQQTETITASAGYDGIEEVDVTVGAISSSYVGTGITRRSSSDLTASGATVTVPSGYYSAQASKAVATGTAGTPTATKGTVNNHSVSVTPSVTNTTGYITGSTKTGTAVTVSASELVSGSQTITSNQTVDVTNLAEVVVNVSGGGGGTTVEALSVTQNGTYTAPTGKAYSPVTVNVSGGASNVVTGTFTGTTTGAAMDINLNYSGNGYPIVVITYPEGGAYNSNIPFYSLTQRYASQCFYAIKAEITTTPTYTGTYGNKNEYASVVSTYKNSTSTATQYSRSSNNTATLYDNASAEGAANVILKVKSKTTLSVYIASTSYGFAANIPYRYWIIYSS